MPGMFYGLEIARRGLNVNKQAMQLTGHNVANAGNEGYTRQRLVIESLYPSTKTRLGRTLTVGSGADVTQIDQVRSQYIDRQLRNEYAALGQWDKRSEEMQFIETIFNETAESGSISTALAEFYDSLGKLTTEAGSEEVRTVVQQNGIKLCETFNYYYNQLVELQKSYNEAMSVTVDKINGLLSSIADYNGQIMGYELGGQKANELKDSRNMLLDELSQLVNISYSEDSSGRLSVSVDGTVLIDHATTTLLEVAPDQTGIVSGEPNFYSIYYEGTTTDFAYSGGELKAYSDLRDGNATSDMGVPYLLNRLNTLARGLAQEFNTVHETGYTIPIGAGASLTGIDFFELPAGGYGDITAGNLSLSAEVLANVRNIAASDAPVDFTAADTQAGNNVIALQMYALTTSTTLGTVGSFADYLKSFVVEVGVTSSGAQERAGSQNTIIGNLETRRESISGVSVDEEMINLISYQYAYSAASRVLTAVDEALDVLINRTGVVGR